MYPSLSIQSILILPYSHNFLTISFLLFIVAKLESKQEFLKLESLTHDIFQILIDQKEASEENILIFSIIKDYEKLTINLILPSTRSRLELTDYCYSNLHIINQIICRY